MSLITGGSANLVPCVTNASATLSVTPTSGGGGGGGGGPNPQVSTITVAPNGSINMAPGANINYTTSLEFENTANDSYFRITEPANGAIGIELQTPDGNHGVSMSVDGTAFYIDTYYNSDQIIIGRSVPTTISSLTVSSINGATPGGGGSIPADLEVSTILFGDSGGGISGLDISVTGALVIQDANTTALNDIVFGTRQGTAPNQFNSMAILAPGGNNSISVESSDSGISAINAISSLTVNCQDLLTLQSPSVSVQASSGLTINSASGMIVNAPTTIPELGISSMTVSTINGAPYSPTGSIYPKVSSIGVGGGGVQTVYDSISTGSFAQFTTPFDVELGHLYQISWNYSLFPSAPASYGEYAQFQAYGVSVAPARAVNADLSVSTISQGQLVLAAAATGQAYLGCLTNTANPVTLDLNYTTTNVELIDMGPIGTSF